MADATTGKKKQVSIHDRKWSVWLSEFGTLSFGSGNGQEVEITKEEYADFVKLAPEARFAEYTARRAPPVAAEPVAVPAPEASAETTVPTEVVAPVEAAPPA